MLSYLGRGPDSITRHRDARSKRQRFLRGTDGAVPRQAAQRSPVDGIGRSVVQCENELGMRVLEFDAVDSPVDRDGLALIVEIRVAVMGVRRGHQSG